MSRVEAHQRVEYAKRAVEAAVKMCRTLSDDSSGETHLGGAGESEESGSDTGSVFNEFMEMG